MSILFLLSFILLLIICIWLVSTIRTTQIATFWVSKYLLEGGSIPVESSLAVSLKKLQALITPKSQSIKQILFPISIISMIVLGLQLAWYLSLIGVIIIIVLSKIIGVLNNRYKLYGYIDYIQKALYKKQTKFISVGDKEKSKFIENLILLINESYLTAKDKDINLKKAIAFNAMLYN